MLSNDTKNILDEIFDVVDEQIHETPVFKDRDEAETAIKYLINKLAQIELDSLFYESDFDKK